MNRILFKVSKNLLIISNYDKDMPKNGLNNTTVIDTKELIFSPDYILKNLDLVSSFLNVIMIKRHINKAIIKDFDLSLISLDILNNMPSILDLEFKSDDTISYDIVNKILDNRYLKNISVYEMPGYLLELLDKNNIVVNNRSEILFESKFMETNKINTFSDLYYIKKIVINYQFQKKDYDDIYTLFKVNKYLKVIEFTYIDNINITKILSKLFEYDIKNVKIIFHEENIDLNKLFDTVNYFKRSFNKEIKKNKIEFKINYSIKYIANNLFKQLNINFMKITLLSTILVVTFLMCINIYKNYNDKKNYDEIEKDLSLILEKNKIDEEIPEEDNTDVEYIDIDGKTTTTTTSIYDKKYNKVFDELLNINKDTVGWLTINNTKIDYPVVYYDKDNDYYLTHDYYKNKNRHGWIFMDYRNNPTDLDRNTIIYGHNLSNQRMFGTLRYVLNKKWYQKVTNQVITFNILNQDLRWQIISIYKVPVTVDYLTTKFASDDEYLDFLDKMVERSIYDFNVSYDASDKILTLSTCANGTKERLVVHAKLIKES